MEPYYVFNILMVEVANGFKIAIIIGYNMDRYWKPIMDVVYINQKKDNGNYAKLPYKINNNLLYLINHVRERRLVIPNSMVKEVFKQAYNKSNYAAFKHAFKKLYGLIM
jgi:archaellum biogenesis protein FlaJ (TadC family)